MFQALADAVIFNAGGHCLDADRSGQLGHGSDDGPVKVALIHALDELAIYL